MQRSKVAAITDDLLCPIMGTSSDEEIALDHGVRPEQVRKLRERIHRDLVTPIVHARLRELAVLLDWRAGLGALLEGVLSDAVALETQRQAHLDELLRELSRDSADRRPSSGDVRRPRVRHAGRGDQIAAVSCAEKSVSPSAVTTRSEPRRSGEGRGHPGGSTRPRLQGRQRSAQGS